MATRNRSRRQKWRDFPLAMAMLAPSAIILTIFVLYPLGRAVWLGQQRCDNFGNNCVSNGFGQYLDLFRSDEFQHALWVTVKFAIISVPMGLVLGIGLAVIADKYLRGISVFRTVFSSTVATSVAVASLMWLFLLQPSVGALANVEWFVNLFPAVKDPGWLQDPGTALTAVAASNVWANLGFTFILVTAGLQSIPRELHEAAAVDGAGGVRRFWAITLPMLGPTMLFLVIVMVSRSFQVYGEIDLLTDGGPQPEASTTTMTYFIYGDASPINGDVGLQAGGAVLLFLILLVLSALQVVGMGRRVHYG